MTKKKGNKKRGGGGGPSRPMEYASDEGQVYGVVEKALGDRTFTVRCVDNKLRRSKLRQKREKGLRRQPIGKIVVVALRDFDDDNADIVWVYKDEEARRLKKEKLIPDWSVGMAGTGGLVEDEDDGTGFDFNEI